MCGIAGAFRPHLQDASLIQALEHRGPDGLVWEAIDDSVSFGHARLAIIDPSPAGRQPMRFGPWAITYNGEIYNFRELRAHLEAKGERFTTQTDTEVLLRMWAVYGADCLPALDGQFAFAVYNTDSRELTLVRDRAGEKPLYWRAEGMGFWFASELRPLIWVGDAVDQESLALYALYRYVPAPRTILRGVQKLPPAHILVYRPDGTHTLRRWWSWEVEPHHDVSVAGFRAAVEQTEAMLQESVCRRLVADVPLGMFLSGGIDSSLTAAFAAAPKTFSIGFEGAASEHLEARAIAKHLGTEHHEHMVTPADFEAVGRGIGAKLDEPNGDRSCVPAYLLSRFAREHVKVALSGDGGDELFGGYQRYFHGCTSPADYYANLLPVYGDAHPGEMAAADPLWRTLEPLHARRALDFNRYLPGCVLSKMDRMSMQHGLEVRTPFLMPDLMDLARTLPAAYLVNGGMGKLVLREIASRHLPRDVALAPKRGFGMPKGVFSQNSKAIAEMIEDAKPHCASVGFPEPPSNMNAVWNYIVLGQWLGSL